VCSSFLSFAARVNQDLRSCPIELISQNPSRIVASALKNSPTFLHCEVTTAVDDGLANDLKERQFYNFDNDDNDDDRDDDDDDDKHYDPEEVKKYYQQQKQQHNKENANHRPDLMNTNLVQLQKRNNKNPIDNNIRRLRRAAVRFSISYEWLRNDNSFISINGSSQATASTEGFTLFSNGTLKFQVTNATGGVYRCRATYRNQEFNFDIGPIVSTASNVELACECNHF
jgi:polyribonucleotide nucleotidyltransferase